MLNKALGGVDMSVHERQRAVLQWQQEQLQLQLQLQQQQQQQYYFNENLLSTPAAAAAGGGQNFQQRLMTVDGSGLNGVILNRPIKQDPNMESRWPDFGSRSRVAVDLDHSAGARANGSSGDGYGLNYALSRTTGCLPREEEVAAVIRETVAVVATGTDARESNLQAEKVSAIAGSDSFKKRKPEKTLLLSPMQVDVEEDTGAKKFKACGGGGQPKNTDQQQNGTNSTSNKRSGSTSNDSNEDKNNREASGSTSKENSKVSEVKKPEYIHVRARRGQATDSHSLAERVRREKISERMKLLQDLVPGCNKITGKAGMLDEIINYVQSLQRQVEFLSMKLATVNPRLDFNIEDLFAKEVFPAFSAAHLPTMGVSPDLVNQSYHLQFNPVQQMGRACSSDVIRGHQTDTSLQQSISAHLSIPESFPDSSGFSVITPSSHLLEILSFSSSFSLQDS
ncbi:hypothetical protein Dimus_002297 [Dionaea muscipula]